MAQDWHFHSGELGNIPRIARLRSRQDALPCPDTGTTARSAEREFNYAERVGVYGPHLALRSSALPLWREAPAAPAINNVDELKTISIVGHDDCSVVILKRHPIPGPVSETHPASAPSSAASSTNTNEPQITGG